MRVTTHFSLLIKNGPRKSVMPLLERVLTWFGRVLMAYVLKVLMIIFFDPYEDLDVIEFHLVLNLVMTGF